MKVPSTLKNPTLPDGISSLIINLNDVSIGVGRTPDGKAVLSLGPLLTTINVTMPNAETASNVAEALKEASGIHGGIVIPQLNVKL